jgi:hypothetical protein
MDIYSRMRSKPLVFDCYDEIYYSVRHLIEGISLFLFVSYKYLPGAIIPDLRWWGTELVGKEIGKTTDYEKQAYYR